MTLFCQLTKPFNQYLTKYSLLERTSAIKPREKSVVELSPPTDPYNKPALHETRVLRLQKHLEKAL